MDGVEKSSSREWIFMKREHGSDNNHFVERRSMFQAWTVALPQAAGAHFLYTPHSDVNYLALHMCVLDFFLII